MKAKIQEHAIIYDGTSYYVVSIEEANAILKNDKYCEIVKQGTDFVFLNQIADKLNEFS